MTRWQAIMEIVKSFNDKDRPSHALVALMVLIIIPVAMAALIYAGGSRLGALLVQ